MPLMMRKVAAKACSAKGRCSTASSPQTPQTPQTP